MDPIERVAREAMGFESLRAGQRDAIESTLAGRDTLAVMSTGSGKSAIYQIAGLLIPGATVAPPVREEIVERLGLRDPHIVVRGFDRPNLRLEADAFFGDDGGRRRDRALLERAAEAPSPGILYVATRRRAEELAAALAER